MNVRSRRLLAVLPLIALLAMPIAAQGIKEPGDPLDTLSHVDGRLVAQPAVEPVEDAESTGCTTATLYSNGFESGSGLGDWTKGTFIAGGSTTGWRGFQTCTAETGTQILRYGGLDCTDNYGSSSFSFAQPTVAVPAGATATRLSFWHRRDFETGYDGGTLTVSVDGTAYVYVPASAILSGTTYNGTVAADCPPSGTAGVSIFTGTAATFTYTTVNLDAACNAATGSTGGCAGRTVRIGFTTITDCSITGDGWFLDDVTVTACN